MIISNVEYHEGKVTAEMVRTLKPVTQVLHEHAVSMDERTDNPLIRMDIPVTEDYQVTVTFDLNGEKCFAALPLFFCIAGILTQFNRINGGEVDGKFRLLISNRKDANERARLIFALDRIANGYQSAEEVMASADGIGVTELDALEMAYDNLQGEAQHALNSIKK